MINKSSIITVGAIILLAISGLLFSITTNNDAELFILRSPTTAKVSINDKEVRLGSDEPSIRTNEGTITIKITEQGFEEYTEIKKVSRDTENIVLASLKPLTLEARTLLEKEEETSAREEIEGTIQAQKTLDQEFQRLADLLPISSRQYRIDIGVSAKAPGERLAVYITADEAQYYEWALSWIKRQGIDPTQYEYVFRTFEDIGQ